MKRFESFSAYILFILVFCVLLLPNSVFAQIHPFSGSELYVDPDSSAAEQIAEWGTQYPKKRALLQKIATEPSAAWFGDWNSAIKHDVAALVSAADSADQIPVMVLYNIPLRDCGAYSSGGAVNSGAYKTFVKKFVQGIGDSRAIVIVEPDALGVVSCLTADQKQTRFALIAYAVNQLSKLPNTFVYIDAGHPNWVKPKTMARRLQKSGVADADGFALNVSNFYHTKRSIRYGENLSVRLAGAHFVVDTSRNGQGPTEEYQWCNPPGMGLGHVPTTAPKNALIDALLWVKPPGESDGTCNSGPAAGQWWLEYALALAKLAE